MAHSKYQVISHKEQVFSNMFMEKKYALRYWPLKNVESQDHQIDISSEKQNKKKSREIRKYFSLLTLPRSPSASFL